MGRVVRLDIGEDGADSVQHERLGAFDGDAGNAPAAQDRDQAITPERPSLSRVGHRLRPAEFDFEVLLELVGGELRVGERQMTVGLPFQWDSLMITQIPDIAQANV